jgi:hypothetical protein
MKVQEGTSHHSRFPKWLIRSAIVLLTLVGAAFTALAIWWPFTREATISSLEQVSFSEVKIGRFEKLFFPRPGYIAQDVTFKRDNAMDTRPLARIRKITCRSSWLALLTLTHQIARMDLESVQVYIPAYLPPAIRKHPEARIPPTVMQLSANGAVLEIAPRHKGAEIERFDFPQLVLSNLAKNKAIRFRTLMLNRKLVGQIGAIGSVGPLTLGRIAETRISGDYHIRDRDLSTYKVVAGTLSADGRFNGTLGRAEVAGRSEIPNFSVTTSRHSLGLAAEYKTIVDAIKGDVAVQSAEAHFLSSILIAHGSITGHHGKTLSLDIDGRHARVEDLLRLFVKADRPPLDGALTMHAHVVLPPKHEPFLRRVQLDGNFAINGAEFTKRMTQGKLDELSGRASGKKKAKVGRGSDAVAAELKSDVKLQAGIAMLSETHFSVPGAAATGTGTYNLLNESIDLRGKLAMRTTLSKAAGGVKSLVLMPLDPFFKRSGAGAVLPLRITGTYSHPVFKVLLTK